MLQEKAGVQGQLATASPKPKEDGQRGAKKSSTKTPGLSSRFGS